MKRFQVMFKQRRLQLLVALAALTLAVAVVVGSGASFTAQSVNASNVFSAGTLAMTNTPTGMGTTISNMVPGDYHSGTVVIKNTGTVSGHFYLQAVTISGDSLANNGFAKDLQLTIVEDGASTPLYQGTLAGLTQQDLGTWPAGTSHSFAFTVAFPDNGLVGGVGADNAYMGATTTAAFNWQAVSASQGSL